MKFALRMSCNELQLHSVVVDVVRMEFVRFVRISSHWNLHPFVCTFFFISLVCMRHIFAPGNLYFSRF